MFLCDNSFRKCFFNYVSKLQLLNNSVAGKSNNKTNSTKKIIHEQQFQSKHKHLLRFSLKKLYCLERVTILNQKQHCNNFNRTNFDESESGPMKKVTTENHYYLHYACDKFEYGTKSATWWSLKTARKRWINTSRQLILTRIF